MHALPDIEVTIVEYSELEHNRKNGIDRGMNRGSLIPSTSTSASVPKEEDKGSLDPVNSTTAVVAATATSATTAAAAAVTAAAKAVVKKKEKKSADTAVKEKEQMYYLVSCRDNGCGELENVLFFTEI